MDQNEQSKTTLQKQARRRRNRSKPNTQSIAPEASDSLTTRAPSNPKAAQPSAPAEPNVAPAAPKRHRHRIRKRNKTQPVDTSEVPTEQIELQVADLPPTPSQPAQVDIAAPTQSPTVAPMKSTTACGASPPSKPSKEQVLADREAKRLAKQAAKHKIVDNARDLEDTSPVQESIPAVVETKVSAGNSADVPKITSISDAKIAEKSREEVMAEREAKKLAKLAAKTKGKPPPAEAAKAGNVVPETKPVDAGSVAKGCEGASEAVAVNEVAGKVEQLHIAEKPVLTKAERRAKQEAQRAAKAALTVVDKKVVAKTTEATKTPTPAPLKKALTSNLISSNASSAAAAVKLTPLHRVKLFNHLYVDRQPPSNAINSATIHPSVVKLGAQYANRIVVGANARCIAFMNTMKEVIAAYETPTQKEFSRGLESALQPCLAYLQQCRPLSVSISNAMKFIKMQITHLPADESEAEQKERLLESIDTYIRDQVEKAAQAISISVQQKISNGDVILTFGCSSLISHILEEAQKRSVDFRVVVVDARPDHEGQEMLRRLVAQGIRCTCVLINAVAFIMPEVTKVLLGANALMANGYVMSRAGTAQVALLAKAHNVPVLVCCETHKFSERVQTDAFVYNEIGNPNALVLKSTTARDAGSLSTWETLPHLTPLNLCYDITPPELVTAVVTELAILPCTSVPVILRIQPSS